MKYNYAIITAIQPAAIVLTKHHQYFDTFTLLILRIYKCLKALKTCYYISILGANHLATVIFCLGVLNLSFFIM